MQIKWTKSALNDLALEISYLSTEADINVAKKAYQCIQEKVSKLKQFPALGREGRIFGTRELVIGDFPYIVPYCITNDTIEIIAIFHTKRQLPSTW